MTLRRTIGLLPLVLALASISRPAAGQSNREKEQAQNEYEEEFRNVRGCMTSYGAEYKLVRAFILSMNGYLSASEQAAAGVPYLDRLATGKEDPFSVYRDFKNSFKGRFDGFGSPPQEGWAIMDRYSKERPDFSKTKIECTISAVDFLSYQYIGYEKVVFPILSSRNGKGAIKVIVSNRYIKQRMTSTEIDIWSFGIEDEGEGAVATTWVGGGRRPRGLETVGDVVRPPARSNPTTRNTAEKIGIQWTNIPGGTFMMGVDEPSMAQHAHLVTIKSFQMAKTLVTNKQYKACVATGACEPPSRLKSTLEGDHQPVVGVDQHQAKAFAAWAGGRLPSEAEWEYAARSAGKRRKYPWGDAEATCDLAAIRGCESATLPVCSKPKGNTEQGLCDMAGNAWEWVADSYHESYDGAPTDGSAWEGMSGEGVHRGGSWFQTEGYARTGSRSYSGSKGRSGDVGLRIAR